jgi:uncharacterized Zn finger protein (UPF0148 family)
MVSPTSEINLPESFECKVELPDDQCGALNNVVTVSNTTGEVSCAVCNAVLGIKEEEEEDAMAIEEGDTDDDSEIADDEEGATEAGTPDILTEWDADKRKEEGAKTALKQVSEMLDSSSVQEAQVLGSLVRQEYYQILQTHQSLADREFYPPRTYRKEMILTSILIHLVKERKYLIDNKAIRALAEDPNKINPRVREGIRLVSGEENGPIVTWMRVHGGALEIPNEIIEQAVDFFLDTEPRLVVGDDEIKALAWLLLTCRTAGYPLTTVKISQVTGRSRPALGRVTKAYAPYFDDGNE